MSRKRILLADDNRCLRAVMLSALGQDFDVHGVGDGRLLEAEIEQEDYDLVITDLNLPFCTGSSVLRRNNCIKIGDERLGVPTIVITGMDPEDDQVRLVRRMVNVHHVFFKPLDMAVLRRRVAEVLNESVQCPLENAGTLQTRLSSMKKVLVVDDDPEMRDLHSLTFEEEGYQVCACSSAGSASDLGHKSRFDLVLLDYELGAEMADDVIDALEEAYRDREVPPILVVSGYGDLLAMDQFGNHPQVKGIVSKSSGPDVLLGLAGSLVGRTAPRDVVAMA